MKNQPKSPNRLVASLLGMSLVGILLLIIRIVSSDSTRYIYLIWNLFLAVVPALLAWWLIERLKKHRWSDPKQIIITIGWFLFLPNSFYLVTDFVHLRETFEASLVYDIVMFTSFAVSGLIFGYSSVFLVHKSLTKRINTKKSWQIVGLVFFVCSFAIYLGRYTRWNTWDVLLKPAGLLFDVSDRVVNPIAHSQTYETTLIFFILLTSIYWVIWESARYLKSETKT